MRTGGGLSPALPTQPRDTSKDYTLLELIGKGAFATVHRATYHPPPRDRRPSEDRAIKRIEKDNPTVEHIGRITRHEIAIHGKLSDPYILKLYDTFQDNDCFYLVLEYCQNGDLDAYVSEKKALKEAQARDFMYQIVRGVQYLHHHHIVHRDLKPKNILLTKDYGVKIADFGFAKRLTLSDPTIKGVCGTPSYVAPEIASGKHHGLESDLWSLGCTLYKLLEGQGPFDGKTSDATIQNAVKGDYEFRRTSLSSASKDVIGKLLRIQPDDRMTLEGILNHRFMSPEITEESCKENLSPPRNVSVDSGINTTKSSAPSSQLARSKSSQPTNVQRVPPSLKQGGYQEALKIRRNVPASQNVNVHQQTRPLRAIQNVQHNDRPRPENSQRDPPAFNERRSPDSTHRVRGASPRRNFHSDGSSQRVSTPVSDASRQSRANDGKHVPKPERLNARRLKPLSETKPNAILSITPSGLVEAKFIHLKSRTVEVFRISTDGEKIKIYKRVKIASENVDEIELTEKDVRMSCLYDDLREDFWPKYRFAAKFVDIQRALTPKVVYYTDHAKYKLMENGPDADFEARFYSRLVMTYNAGNVEVQQKGDRKYSVTVANAISELPDALHAAWARFQQFRDACLSIERAIEDTERTTYLSHFPITIGSPPRPVGKMSCSKNGSVQALSVVNKENSEVQSSVKSNHNSPRPRVPKIKRAKMVEDDEYEFFFEDETCLLYSHKNSSPFTYWESPGEKYR